MKRSVLAAVDLDSRAADIVRRAANLARLCRADLVVLHAVDDRGLAETGYVPFIHAAEVRNGTLREAKGWLVGLLHHLGVSAAEVVVIAGRPREAVAALAIERHACYIVAGRSKWGAFGELAGLGKLPEIRGRGCEVLSVDDALPRRFSDQPVSALRGTA